MKKVKNLFLRFYHIRGLKYILVTVIAVALIGFLDENSVWKHMVNRQHIGELQDEIDRLTEQYQHDQAQVKELDRNPKLIEKIARERYFMKADDEDIFVLSDDDRIQTTLIPNETTE